MEDDETYVRKTAIKQVEHRNDVNGLIAGLSNDVSDVRASAAWHIGRQKFNQAIDPLLKQLEIEPKIEPLRALIWALGIMGDEAVKLQLERFATHESALIRDTVAQALETIVRNADT